MKRLLILLAILAPAIVAGQQTVRFKNIKIDSNLTISSMPTDTSKLILVLGADGKVRVNRSAGGTGATTDSLAWYRKAGAAWQRYPSDSVVINRKITAKGNDLWMYSRSTTTPATSNAEVYLSGTSGSMYIKAMKDNPPFSNAYAMYTLAPATGASGWNFSTDEFGTYAYQLDEYGFYPTDYTTAGDYNQYIGTPANKWRRGYFERLVADTIPSGALYPPLASSQWTTESDGIYYNGGKVGIGTTNPSATDSTMQVTGSMNVSRGAKFGYDISVNGLTVGKGNRGVASNTAVGVATLGSVTTGNSNTSVGMNSSKSLITGSNNTSVGDSALYTNTNGGNTAIGSRSLVKTTASGNTAVGAYSMWKTTSGSNNTAIGYTTLYRNTTGQYNVSIGSASLFANTTGNGNIGIGRWSLNDNTTGSENVSIGYDALGSISSGHRNTAIGSYSFNRLTSGSNNIALGDSAGYSYTTISNRMYLGARDTVGTTSGIYFDRTPAKRWGKWMGTLKVTDIPADGSPDSVLTVVDGLVKRAAFPAGTTYTATSPMSVAGNNVHILTDTLAEWRTKQNKGATAYGWGDHSGLYEPIIEPIPIVAGNYYAKHDGTGTTSWEPFPTIPTAYDTATNPWRYLSGNTVQRGTGNVGIGNSAPTQALEVGASSAGGNVVVNATLGTELAPALTGNSGVLWTLSNTTGYVQPFAGTIEKDGNGTGSFTPTAATTIVAGTKYLVQIVLSSISGGELFASIGNVTLARITTAGTYNYYVVAENTSKISFLPLESPTRFVITSISIKAMTAGTGDITVPGNVTASEIRNPNGNGYIHLSPDGRVGINTRNPATGVLDVSGNIRWGTGAYWTNGNMSYTGMYNTYNGAYVLSNNSTGTSSAMAFHTKNVEAMRISPAQYIGIGTTNPTELISLGGNSARKIWMERHTTANTAGNALTFQAGGATLGATDKAGGPIVWYQGASTGNATGTAFQWYTYDAGSTGTSEQTATAKMTIQSTGVVQIPKIQQTATDTTGMGSTANIGMMMYYNGHFYGLKGGTPPTWVQLDN